MYRVKEADNRLVGRTFHAIFHEHNKVLTISTEKLFAINLEYYVTRQIINSIPA